MLAVVAALQCSVILSSLDSCLDYRGMMMTACDIAAITKPWKIQQRVANMVADEFFEQGDMERKNLQVEPIVSQQQQQQQLYAPPTAIPSQAMMDRRKKNELPKMQVGFIDFVCMPLYTLLANLVPELHPLLYGLKRNRQNWQSLTDDPKGWYQVGSGHCINCSKPVLTGLIPLKSYRSIIIAGDQGSAL